MARAQSKRSLVTIFIALCIGIYIGVISHFETRTVDQSISASSEYPFASKLKPKKSFSFNKSIPKNVNFTRAYKLKLSEDQHEACDKMVRRIYTILERDLRFQAVLKDRKEEKKKCLRAKPKKMNRDVVIYHENALYMWGHLHLFDDQTKKIWLNDCSTPCLLTNDIYYADKYDVYLSFWGNDITTRPRNLKQNQRVASISLEPWVGAEVSEERLREGLTKSGVEYYDIIMSWASDIETDISINYAYGARLQQDFPHLFRGLNHEQYNTELRKSLHERFKLPRVPVFDKDLYFNSIPEESVGSPLDRRGGDVAFFVSNCDQGIWRTPYFGILLDLLTAPKPHGYDLKVDSFGGCYPNLGYKREKDGVGYTISEVLNAGPKFDWNNPRKVKNIREHFPNHYPRKRKEGENRNNVVKREMLDHYKVSLNFENSLIHNYVSEKFFEGLTSESVAIYFGSSTTEEFIERDDFGRIVKAHADPRAFTTPHEFSNVIDGWNYPDPRAMAAKIYELCTNQELWESHFHWRVVEENSNKLIDFKQEFVDFHRYDFTRQDKDNFVCRACEHYARLDC